LEKRGYVLTILSTNDEDSIVSFLAKNGIRDHFKVIYHGSSVFGKTKLINKFIRNNSISKENVWYIGDETRDIDAAKQAGIKIISVSWGWNTAELLRGYNNVVVDKADDLLNLF